MSEHFTIWWREYPSDEYEWVPSETCVGIETARWRADGIAQALQATGKEWADVEIRPGMNTLAAAYDAAKSSPVDPA